MKFPLILLVLACSSMGCSRFSPSALSDEALGINEKEEKKAFAPFHDDGSYLSAPLESASESYTYRGRLKKNVFPPPKDFALQKLFSPPLSTDSSSDHQSQRWDRIQKPQNRSHIWLENLQKKLSYYSRRWVRERQLKARKAPSRNAPVIRHLQEGDMVWVQSISNNWARLKTGVYVPVEGLSHQPPSRFSAPLSTDPPLFSD